MSTPTLDESARLLALSVLRDTIQIFDVGAKRTEGINVVRDLTPVGTPVPGLVQDTTLQNAVESQTTTTYSVKVARGTAIRAGQVVQVISCQAEPELVGKKLLLDKVSMNGLALIRKAVASEFANVNQEGKENL
jgi:hypothetical protein